MLTFDVPPFIIASVLIQTKISLYKETEPSYISEYTSPLIALVVLIISLLSK